MGGVRRWPRHRRFPSFAGALAGLLLAATLSLTWHHAYSRSAVTLLGSGRGLSAVISTGAMRVLIVSGDDPIAFANAFADAHPPTMRRIDILILTPDASPYLAERAIDLAAPRRIMAIDYQQELPDEAPDISDPVRNIGAPRTVRLGDQLFIDIDPGLVAGQPATGWMVRIESGSVAILLTALVPFRPSPDVGLIAVMGDRMNATAASISVPVAHAHPEDGDGHPGHGHIAPGEVVPISIEKEAVTVPLTWSQPAEP